MDISQLPALNASLNATCTTVLLAALWAVKTKRIELHRRLMLVALSLSLLFLVSYLTYHYNYGTTHFPEIGWPRTLYLSILLTHTILAAVNLPLVVTTATKAIRGKVESHKKWARVTYPIWLYVSTTGVIIYMMLYQWFPAS